MAWALVTEEAGHKPRFLYFLAASWEGIGTGSDWDHGALAGLLDDDHTQYLLIDGSRAMTGTLYIDDNANAKMDIGITINQSGYDSEILAFKSSDVAHGITDFAETDTYGAFTKIEAACGGCALYGYKEASATFPTAGQLVALTATTPRTVFTPAIRGIIEFWAYYASGTTITPMPAGSCLLTMGTYDENSNFYQKWFVNANGATWQPGNLHVGCDTEYIVSNIGLAKYIGVQDSDHCGIIFDGKPGLNSSYQINFWYNPGSELSMYSSGDSSGAGKYLWSLVPATGALSSVANNPWVKDEDNMASDSAVHCATQQSIKAYADGKVDYTNVTSVNLAGMTSYTIATDWASTAYMRVQIYGYFHKFDTSNCPAAFQIQHGSSGWQTAAYIGAGETVGTAGGGAGFVAGGTSWILSGASYWDSTYTWDFIFTISWHAGNHILSYVEWDAWDRTGAWWSSGGGQGPYGGCTGLRILPYVAGAAWVSGYLYYHKWTSNSWG